MRPQGFARGNSNADKGNLPHNSNHNHMVDKKQDDKEVSEFNDVFNEASAKNGPANEQDTGNDEGKDEDKKDGQQADEGKADEKKSDDANSDKGDDKGGDDEGGKQESAEDKAARLEAENAKLNEKAKTWGGRVSATARENAELKKRLAEIEAEKSKKSDEGKADGKDDGKAEEEDEEVKEFKKDYPNLAKPIEKLLASERKRIQQEVRGELGKEFDEKIKPVADSVQKTNAKSHIDALTEAHPDWRDHTDAVYEWVEEQPAYLQDAMRQVLERGKTEDVIDLLTKYKETNGITAKDDSDRQDDGEEQHSNKDKRQKQADDAEAVRGKPGGKPKGKTQVDKDDFDGAFAAATGKK